VIAEGGYPTPPCFCAKSAETIGNKGVEFLINAKKRKRVRKNVKRKNLSIVASEEWRALEPEEAPLPPVFL
jgi:hypothetical protein